MSACASTGPRDGFAATDDYEPFSRAVHKNNIRIDRYFLRPVTQGYDYVTPTLFQHMISNGLKHIDLTNDFANYLLQGDVDGSLETLGRFTLNTVLGMGGFLDPATEFGLPKDDTDFGLTLASYGVGEGTYLVLPLVGPTTVLPASLSTGRSAR
jgi:phospholipid-binding lipoprotein MlaA